MRVTTRVFDSLVRRQVSPGTLDPGASIDMGMGVASSASDLGTAGDQSVFGMVNNYLEELTAREQRLERAKNIWANIAIQKRMDAIRDQDHIVGPQNPKLPVDAALVAEIEQSLEAPNPDMENNTFGGLWGMGLDDMYTIGQGAIQKLLNKNRTPRGFRAIDASRLGLNPGYQQPNGDHPTKRWIFQETISSPLYFDADEIILLAPYMTTHSRIGLSPIRALRAILQSHVDTFNMMWGTQKYRTPPGVFVMPGAAPGSPQRARLMYDLRMAGRPTIGFMNLPKDSKFIDFGNTNLLTQGTFQFYEILVRATAAGFGTTPFFLGWTDQDNRANSQTQMAMVDRGEVAMLKFLRQIINRTIIAPYKEAYGSRADNIWFTFIALAEEDEVEDATSLRKKAGTLNWVSLNEIRIAGGLEPYTEKETGKELYPFVSQPWVPSRIPGVLLPLKYAAMSFGIVEGGNEALLALSSEMARNPQATPEIVGLDTTGLELLEQGEDPEVQRAFDPTRLASARNKLLIGADGLPEAIDDLITAARLTKALAA